jgi:putative membrane protein
LIIWIPPAMMSVLALVLVLNALRKTEERTVNVESNATVGEASVRASQWTG